MIGAVLYGIVKGAEAIIDAVTTSDQEYIIERNEELGSHELNYREVTSKLKELGKAKDYYENQVKYHFSIKTTDPRKIAKHEKDKAMLASLQQNMDNLNKSFKEGIPVYGVVSTGFDEDSLSGSEKDEYDLLQIQLQNKKDHLAYDGHSKAEENRILVEGFESAILDFRMNHAQRQVTSSFVVKPSEEEMNQMIAAYDINGWQTFNGMSKEALNVLGIKDAIVSKYDLDVEEVNAQIDEQTLIRDRENLKTDAQKDNDKLIAEAKANKAKLEQSELLTQEELDAYLESLTKEELDALYAEQQKIWDEEDRLALEQEQQRQAEDNDDQNKDYESKRAQFVEEQEQEEQQPQPEQSQPEQSQPEQNVAENNTD